MATISSPGIGSGLDVKSIVSQLVALEKQPLNALQAKATAVNAKVSAYGQIKSLVASLADAASQLNSVTGWNAVTATSSDSASVAVAAVGGTAAASFSVTVQSLAKTQSSASQALLPLATTLGSGTIHLEIGSWNAGASVFTPGSSTPVDVSISDTDTVTSMASKINSANAGVTATVLNDASGERLLLRAKSSGAAAGFRMSVVDGDGNHSDNLGLSRLVYGATMTQQGQDATASINGIAVSSATNTFASSIPGVTLTMAQLTTSPVEVNVAQDTGAINQHINDFVTAYNAVNDTLQEATKYDASTKTPGLLQGDATANGLLYALKSVLQSSVAGGAFAKLTEVGITQQLGGNLVVNASQLTTALKQPDEVKNLFRANTGNASTHGIATKLKAFTDGLMAASGLFATKANSLKRELDSNSKDQAKVNDRATNIEAQLNKRYSALDAKLTQLNSLNSYVAQQVTTWNKNTA